MKLFNKSTKDVMNIDILLSSNAIYKGDKENMVRRDSNTTNGFRNATLIILVAILMAVVTIIGNL